jgi:hypothetical protein
MPFIKRSGQQEKPDYKFGAEYMGGHKAFPKKRDTDLLIFRDRIILDKLNLDIPFRSITNISIFVNLIIKQGGLQGYKLRYEKKTMISNTDVAKLTMPVSQQRDHIQGEDSAQATLVEYGDYEWGWWR